jgi:hypothetical protein
MFCRIAQQILTSANQSINQVAHLCIFYSRRIFVLTQDTGNDAHLIIENQHENDNFFKNLLTKKGVEYFSFPTIPIKS